MTREIAEHRFKIPRQYIVDASVFYLPASQKDAVRFVINPSAPLQQQNMVSIHPNATCPPIDPRRPRDADCRIVPLPLRVLEQGKLRRVGDETWWEYRLEKNGQLVAFCSALEAGEGLCRHYGLYEGLPYELSFRDSQMPNLIALRRSTEELLANWEVAK